MKRAVLLSNLLVRNRIIFVLACLAFLAFLSQISVRAQGQDSGAIRVDVNLVVLDATVKTKAGEIMAHLKKDDFEVREDGVAK